MIIINFSIPMVGDIRSKSSEENFTSSLTGRFLLTIPFSIVSESNIGGTKWGCLRIIISRTRLYDKYTVVVADDGEGMLGQRNNVYQLDSKPKSAVHLVEWYDVSFLLPPRSQISSSDFGRVRTILVQDTTAIMDEAPKRNLFIFGILRMHLRPVAKALIFFSGPHFHH